MHQKLAIKRNFHEVWRVIIDVLFLAIVRIINCRTFLRASLTLTTLSFEFFSAEQKEVLTALSEVQIEDLILRVLVIWLTDKLSNHAVLLDRINIVTLIDFWLPEVLLLGSLHLILLSLTVLEFYLLTELLEEFVKDFSLFLLFLQI